MRRWLLVVLAGIVLMLVITREHGEPSAPDATQVVAKPATTTTAHAAAPPPALPGVDEETGEVIAEESSDAQPQRLEGIVVDSEERPVGGAHVTIGQGRE